MPLRSAEVDEFILRARKLEKSAFWRWQNALPIRANWEAIAAGNWLAYEGLREEDLDSFCLTLRLLIQDRDNLSIRKVSQLVEMWPPDYDEQKAAIREAVTSLNERLDGACIVSIHNGRTTKRELFETLFYGGLVHSDPHKREAYAKLISSGPFSGLVFSAFWAVLCDFRNCIQTMAHHIAKAIVAAGES